MQSTRLVVMSRSSTRSCSRSSMASTANPRSVRSSASCFGSTGTSTNSRNQERGTFTQSPLPLCASSLACVSLWCRSRGARSRELLQEAQVAAVEEADVVDAMLHQGHALDAQSEGEAGDLPGVVDHA